MDLVMALKIAGAISLTYAASRVAVPTYDAIYRRVRVWQDDRLVLRGKAQRLALESLKHILPDANGRSGWVIRPDGSILNPATAALIGRDWKVEHIEPVWRKVEMLERLVLAQSNHQGAASAQELLPASGPMIPEFITPDQVMGGSPSYRRLVLGRTEHETITADMADLVHVAVGGSSGWGKSVFLRWLVYQLIKSTDPVQLALIDLEGVTLSPFANSRRVLWPLADTEQDAVSVLTQLAGEMNRRKEMYGTYTGVDSLYSYNERAMDEDKAPLLPIVVVVDEATALLENKSVERHLRTLATRARKFGLWLILAGQDWKGSSLDTTIRNQIGARVHFRAMSSSQSRVLMGVPGAEELDVKGRAMVLRPGEETVVLQTPMIKYSDMRGLRGDGPLNPMPVQEEGKQKWTVEYIREVWAGLDTKNKSEMCRALWADMGRNPPAPTGGSFWGEVDVWGKRAGIWE
jgi:hypothetical protein